MRTAFGVKTAEVSTSSSFHEETPVTFGSRRQASTSHPFAHERRRTGVRVENGDLLLARVQITSDEGHDHGLLFLRAAALGLSEAHSSARPFS